MAEPVKVTDWGALRRVVYRDKEYASSWVKNGAELARFFAEKGGFLPLNAYQLREWLKAQSEGAADGSVCFFSQDVAPDMVAEELSADCLLMRYIRAGGRVVWVGDVPFYYQGQRGGGQEIWGVKGQQKILGLKSVWDLKDEPRLTEAGAEWGLTHPGNASRCVPASEVTAALSVSGKYACCFFNNYNPELPHSGFLKLREFIPAADLLRAALHGIEEPEAAQPAAAPAADPAPAGGEGELAGSGSFVVDKGRALDKLMRYQLPDPESFLLPALRCAIAAGATAVHIEEVSGGLEVRFDGGAFARESFTDAYAALFEPKTEGNAAARHLATAILCALRLKPSRVTFKAGAPGSRFRFKTEGLGTEAVQPSEEPGSGCALGVYWRGPFGALRRGRLLEKVRERAALSPVPVYIGGKDLPRSRAGSGTGYYFEEKGLHGFIGVPEWPQAASRLSAAVHSVLLDNPLTPKLPHLQVEGYLNSDDFTMNISQTGVVDNTRCSRAVGAAAKRVPLLLDAVLREQGNSLAAAARAMLYGGLDRYWRKRADGGPPRDPGVLGALIKQAGAALLRGSGQDASRRARAERALDKALRTTLWLRDGAARLLGPAGPKQGGELHKALWKAPLLLTIHAETRSLEEAAAQAGAMGFLPYSTKPYPDAALPFGVYWCPSQADLEPLRRWDTADLTERIPHYAVNPAAAEEFLGGSGLRLLAIRNRLEIVPASRAAAPGMKPVEISLAGLEAEAAAESPPAPPKPPAAAPAGKVEIHPEPSPFPGPPATAEQETPEEAPAPARRRKPSVPTPKEAELAADPAGKFPLYLSRRAGSIKAPGARLLAKYISDRALKPRWIREDLPSEVLASGLPVSAKADYLLSVFYSEYNRQEVKLTDEDDVNFQRALAVLALEKERGD